MALQGLYVPALASWVPDLRSELLSFPTGKYDDAVDALGLVGQLLDQMAPGHRPPEPEKPRERYKRDRPSDSSDSFMAV
jgi:hypothetical protein